MPVGWDGSFRGSGWFVCRQLPRILSSPTKPSCNKLRGTKSEIVSAVNQIADAHLSLHKSSATLEFSDFESGNLTKVINTLPARVGGDCPWLEEWKNLHILVNNWSLGDTMDSSKQAEQLKQEVAAYQSQLKLLREELNDLSKSSLNHLPQRSCCNRSGYGTAVETYQLVLMFRDWKMQSKTWNWSSRAAATNYIGKEQELQQNAKTWEW